MVELRKRKTPPPAPVRPAKTQKKTAPKSKIEKVKEVVKEKVEAVKEFSGASNGEPSGDAVVPATGTGVPQVGDTIPLTSFGGEVETHDGTKTTLAKLVEESKAGVVLFTYPKASTPGCTKQACLFRDSYEPLTVGGLSIYGLSTDSPKSNTTFKTKQNLPYPLICDPKQSLISAIGLKGPKSAKRGVFVVDKSGKVLAAELGSPDGTVAVVKKIVDGSTTADGPNAPPVEGEKEDKEIANTASEVADSAAKIDA
ncbi:merozoite capping protein-1 [Bimuria novae-zelandiae CBS 107.79]|uniref:thioredoxin-dependent peroxiredoxin n=1 Tax=Bimuria novae-zelandiae CBS 107.79 TaxID=1447943 RepID=A0A6A5VS81_9PLEO|nr:merozoite capping protein-1 [Bimuria novae-zelandiae CBS 107.79]